ncbi:hypothetical protein FBUS_09079 [Fasciolopsis buskii]|uniref:Uncharacterized protein n=1 Tax=Fasciolopsis buskii TaxID=27845 RepID=A0A8E0RWR1_9TREM|nr:hypothetical protein FBUS_09079 [Fasciolopsis buski]
MEDEEVKCKLCCLKVVKKKKAPRGYMPKPLPEDPFLDMKAIALANVLFLADDLYALRRIKKLRQKTLQGNEALGEQCDEQYADLYPQSFVLKAYLFNNARQIARVSLLAGIQLVCA